jgi:hypothetical protein
VEVTFSGTLDAKLAALVEALRANLPNVFLAFTTRGQSFVDLLAEVAKSAPATFDPGKLGLEGSACVAMIAPIVVQAATNIQASMTAAGSIAASTGGA